MHQKDLGSRSFIVPSLSGGDEDSQFHNGLPGHPQDTQTSQPLKAAATDCTGSSRCAFGVAVGT
jgi:hypothetical protein